MNRNYCKKCGKFLLGDDMPPVCRFCYNNKEVNLKGAKKYNHNVWHYFILR